MKKILFGIIAGFLFYFSNSAVAQCPVPNGDFSDWTNDTVPSSWNGAISFDLFIYTYNFYTSHKTTDAHSAPNACVIISEKTIPILGTLLPGVLSLGNQYLDVLNMGFTYSGGIPVNVRPISMRGYYKYEFPVKDTFSIKCICKKGGDIIATGEFRSEISKSVYTSFNIPINYTIEEIPDSINIICMSSAGYVPKSGTSLYLDDLEVDYEGSGGPESISIDDMINAYPNPSADFIFLTLNENEKNTINVYDITGRLIFSKYTSLALESLDMRYCQTGLYLIEIRNSKGRFQKQISLIR